MRSKMYEVIKPILLVPPQVLSGASIRYNNTTLGETGPWSTSTPGGYIDATGYSKVQIHTALGAVTGPGTMTISAVAAPSGAFATGIAGTTGINSTSMSITTADDNTTKVMEIDLSKVPQPQVYIKVDHPSTLISNISIVGVLSNPDNAPTGATVDTEFSG